MLGQDLTVLRYGRPTPRAIGIPLVVYVGDTFAVGIFMKFLHGEDIAGTVLGDFLGSGSKRRLKKGHPMW
jgi:hypothetical protein